MDKKARTPKVQTRTGINPKQILDAFNELSRAKGNFTSAIITKMRQQEEFENVKAEALLSGRITGKNVEEREACTRSIFANRLKIIFDAELEEKLARLELDEAEVQADKIKALLRLEEAITLEEHNIIQDVLLQEWKGKQG